MLTRLLLDPPPSDGGAPAPTPTPDPAAGVHVPPPDPAAPPVPEGPVQVTVDASEYKALLDARAAAAEAETRAKHQAEVERQKAVDALARKGEAEEAVRKERDAAERRVREAEDRADRVERERLAEQKNAHLSNALLGADFLGPVAAAQAHALLSGRLETVRDASGKIVTREVGTLRPVDQVVKSWLAASDQSAHFLKPTSRGGAGTRGAEAPPPPPPADEVAKLPFDQQLLIRAKAAAGEVTRPRYGFGTLAPPAPHN